MKPKNANKVTPELAIKLKRLNELATQITNRSMKIIPREVKQAVDNLQFRLEFRLNELLEQCKLNEAAIKIEAMENVMKLLEGK